MLGTLVTKVSCVRAGFEFQYSAVDIRNLLMQIIAQCPGCGNNWLLNAASADKRVRCRKCNRLFRIPKLEEVPKAVKVIKGAKGTVYVDEAGNTYG